MLTSGRLAAHFPAIRTPWRAIRATTEVTPFHILLKKENGASTIHGLTARTHAGIRPAHRRSAQTTRVRLRQTIPPLDLDRRHPSRGRSLSIRRELSNLRTNIRRSGGGARTAQAILSEETIRTDAATRSIIRVLRAVRLRATALRPMHRLRHPPQR